MGDRQKDGRVVNWEARGRNTRLLLIIMPAQVRHAIGNAKDMFILFDEGFDYKSRDILLQLYKALVRPSL